MKKIKEKQFFWYIEIFYNIINIVSSIRYLKFSDEVQMNFQFRKETKKCVLFNFVLNIILIQTFFLKFYESMSRIIILFHKIISFSSIFCFRESNNEFHFVSPNLLRL